VPATVNADKCPCRQYFGGGMSPSLIFDQLPGGGLAIQFDPVEFARRVTDFSTPNLLDAGIPFNGSPRGFLRIKAMTDP
jgi:hypothetical protein